MIVYAAVILCACLLGLLVYRYDMYDREPWYLLLLAVAMGFGAMIGVGHLEDFTHRQLSIGPDQLAGQALVAATHEELVKLLLVAAIAIIVRKHFNDPMDGLIYGVFVGLGMGIEESFYYLRTSYAQRVAAEPAYALIGTEAVRLVLHGLMAGLSGFAVGLAATSVKGWRLALGVWLLVSMGLHFAWDYFVGLPQMTMMPSAADPRWAAVALMLSGIVAFGLTVSLASHCSRLAFAPHSPKKKLWGWPIVRR